MQDISAQCDDSWCMSMNKYDWQVHVPIAGIYNWQASQVDIWYSLCINMKLSKFLSQINSLLFACSFPKPT